MIDVWLVLIAYKMMMLGKQAVFSSYP